MSFKPQLLQMLRPIRSSLTQYQRYYFLTKNKRFLSTSTTAQKDSHPSSVEQPSVEQSVPSSSIEQSSPSLEPKTVLPESVQATDPVFPHPPPPPPEQPRSFLSIWGGRIALATIGSTISFLIYQTHLKSCYPFQVVPC